MYYFIVNLTSRTGKAREIWIKVEQELNRRNVAYEAYVTEHEGHARELADELCTKAVAYMAEQERVCLVVVGGDGTVNEVINGMHHFEEIQFGYIATGSGNDLGRGLKISKDPIEALDGILDAKEVFPMDLGRVTDEKGTSRYFAISSGIGIDADVCRLTLNSKLKKILNHLGLGSLTYVLLTIKALFTMPTTEVSAVFHTTGKCSQSDRTPYAEDIFASSEATGSKAEAKKIDKMIFIAGMNHPWEGGGVPMSPNANPQDGKLSVCCVYGIPRWKTFFLLILLIQAKHVGIKGIEIIDCDSYELHLESPMVLHCDGEYLGEHKVIQYTCEKGKLQVLK